ncbi:MAG TPA: hypothetical protein EYN89_08775 [Flavobacteriales bacterium]|nr:hypothetical protein [Flavobacteriales bacterium]
MKLSRTYIILLLIIKVIAGAYGQNLMNNNWFFGTNAGINFNTSPAPAVSIGGWASVAQEASTAVSDSMTGNLLFYTNSDTIYDASHSPMPNGMNLVGGGHSSNQGVITVPDPGNPDRYYVFSVGKGDLEGSSPTPANWMPPYGGLAYHVVDMTLNGGMGDLASKDNILYLAGPTTMFESRVTAAIHGNGQDYWIIVRRNDGTGTWNFYSYLINASGVQPPVISAASQTGEGFGAMKVSPDGTKIAIAGNKLFPFTGMYDPQYVEVFCFNNQNGKASPQEIYAGGTMFNLANSFSPDSKLLYFVANGLSAMNGLYQIELATNTVTQISTSSPMAMQLGLDGRIYANGGGGSNSISLIDQPNIIGSGCNFMLQSIPLASGKCWTGMCNLINAYEVSAQITADFTSLVADPCDSLTVSFLDGTTGPADQWEWTILNGVGDTIDTSNLQNPIVVFDSAGTYSVQLVSYFECLADTMTKSVSVGNGPQQTTNGFYICSGDSIQLPDASYTSTAGTYYDTLVSMNGCDSVIITNLTLDAIYLSMDTTICEGASILLGGTYQTTGGLYFDSLTAAGGCDSIIITTLNVNQVDSTNIMASICDGDSLFLQGAYQTNAGVYYDILPAASGCDSVISTNLALDGVSINRDTTICDGSTIFLGGAYQNTAGTYYDTISTSGNCDSIIITNLELSSVFNTAQTINICSGDTVLIGNIAVYSAGNYEDTLQTAFGCDSIVSTTVAVYNPPSIQLTNDTAILLGDNFSLFASGASTYIWSTGDTGNTINVSPSQTTTYYVTAISAQGCVSTGMVTITVIVQYNNTYVPNIFALSSNQAEHNRLYVYGSNIETYKFLIYDRWGEVVFETSDLSASLRQDGLCCRYGPGWDGTYNNSEKPINHNVYAYKLTGTFNNGEEFIDAGNLTLLK